jgi:hypothetical protein
VVYLNHFNSIISDILTHNNNNNSNYYYKIITKSPYTFERIRNIIKPKKEENKKNKPM